jgi:hypothetical protein
MPDLLTTEFLLNYPIKIPARLCIGHLNITKYDLQNRVFSGTFEFTIYKSGSDTIKITDGRFDKKL